jgi:hypothetical protein
MTEIENDRELFAAIERYLAAEKGCTKAALRARELVMYAQVNLERTARVQARRDAMRVVDDMPPGDGRRRRGRRPTPSSPHIVQS